MFAPLTRAKQTKLKFDNKPVTRKQTQNSPPNQSMKTNIKLANPVGYAKSGLKKPNENLKITFF